MIVIGDNLSPNCLVNTFSKFFLIHYNSTVEFQFKISTNSYRLTYNWH